MVPVPPDVEKTKGEKDTGTWFSILAGSASKTSKRKKERRQTGTRARRIMNKRQETTNSIRLPVTYNAGYA